MKITKAVTKWMTGAALAGALLFAAPHKAEAQRFGFGVSIGTPVYGPAYYGPHYVRPYPYYPYYGPAYAPRPYYGGYYHGYWGHPYGGPRPAYGWRR